MTKDDRIACSLCAWRGTCAKKFSKSGEVNIHCVDFSRDVTISDKISDKYKEKESRQRDEDEVNEEQNT